MKLELTNSFGLQDQIRSLHEPVKGRKNIDLILCTNKTNKQTGELSLALACGSVNTYLYEQQ